MPREVASAADYPPDLALGFAFRLRLIKNCLELVARDNNHSVFIGDDPVAGATRTSPTAIVMSPQATSPQRGTQSTTSQTARQDAQSWCRSSGTLGDAAVWDCSEHVENSESRLS